VTKHRTPWQTTGDVGIAFDDDVWELYDGTGVDWTQANDLSKEPREAPRASAAVRDRGGPLQRAAARHRFFERVLPEISSRPTLIGDKQLLLPGTGGLVEFKVVNCRNRSWAITAQVDVPDGDTNGVLINLGGYGGGLSFYPKDARLTFCYNLLSREQAHHPCRRSRPLRRASGADRSPTTAATSATAATSPSISPHRDDATPEPSGSVAGREAASSRKMARL
jgi:hypothetical protein